MTSIGMVIDKSGSMANLVNDSVGGFRIFLEEQKRLGNDASVKLVLFDGESKELYAGNIMECPFLDNKNYKPSGSTAMLDALGITIEDILDQQRFTKGFEKDNVIICLLTDGEENYSRKFTWDRIKELITKCRALGWTFVFLGANIDAEGYADKLGMDKKMSFSYSHDSKGLYRAYGVMGQSVAMVRTPKKDKK